MSVTENNKVISNYYASIAGSLNSCFQKGHYKYLNLDGTFSVVEVPLDQFNASFVNMQNFIKEGKIFGVFNPLLAGQMFKPSMFTFEQVKNIAMAGMIDELKADIEKEEIKCPSDIGISPIIAKALTKIDKKFFDTSDLKTAYEQVLTFWKDEKIKKGFLFKKEVELVDDLKNIDDKCAEALEKLAYSHLLSPKEIKSIVFKVKSKKYVDFLKSIIDVPDVDAAIKEKLEPMVKSALEKRKKFKFKRLYHDVLKAYKLENDPAFLNEPSESTLFVILIKRILAVCLIGLAYFSFFEAIPLENRLSIIDNYAIKILSNHTDRFDTLFNIVNDIKPENQPLQVSLESISWSAQIAKVAYAGYDLIMNFGGELFFQFLIPIVLILCSLYFGFGCHNGVSKRFLRLAKVFFVFAVLIRFFTPVNGYLMAKSDEYVFHSKYIENEKIIKRYDNKIKSPVTKGDIKKAKEEQIELANDIVRNSGELISIILIQSLLIPMIAFILLKKMLVFK